jgi:hypothetical protein
MANIISVSGPRFELALEKMRSSDWEHFERLSSTFLAAEFNSVRTMASPGGDRGRDAELYSHVGETNIMFQFAIRKDWESKIRETIVRIKDQFPAVTSIIFMSSQQIGARADAVRQYARNKGISLDIRDRSWFVERVNADDSRSRAASELARMIVDPFLESTGVIQNAPGLKGQEAKTALVFLELQAKDDDTSKGLTKSCYESLVKASLHGTNAENKRSRNEILSYVAALLPQHQPNQLIPFIDAAISRLDRRAIKHYPAQDEFHISHDELERTKDRVAGLVILQQSFSSDIQDIIKVSVEDDQEFRDRSEILLRTIVEKYFFRLGEEFAQSVSNDKEIPLHTDILRDIILDESPEGTINSNITWVDFLYSSSVSLMANPSDKTLELFRVLSAAYTLFAFLSEVPDVQRATKKLFEHGTLWFDTTVLLPLFAEQAFPDDLRPFTDLLVQLKRAGLKLRVTSGVVTEIERHLNLCKHYVRHTNWIGRVPYVYQRYSLGGGTASRFNSWLERFCSDFRPMDDLSQFLIDVAGVETSVIPSWDHLPDSLIDEVRSYWQSIQGVRRNGPDGPGLHTFRLAEHDTENFLSVVAERRIEPGKSILGYTSWLVTMDSKAWKVLSNLSPDSRELVKHSPIISLDFLLKYLSFGPRRDQVGSSIKGHSRVYSSTIFESIPADLIAAAEQVREACHSLDERLIQRRIRDELDKRRMNSGPIQAAGLDGLDAALESMY